MEEHRPDVVIHCAALSNTGYCEQHREESHKVNVQGTVRIAKACKLTGAKLVFMKAAELMGLKDPSNWILPDEERFCEEPRNLTMDCSIIDEHGIHFMDSVEGIEEAIKRPFHTK